MAVPIWPHGPMRHVYDLMSNDQTCPNELTSYSPLFRETIERNWSLICNSMMVTPALICSEYRLRFASDTTQFVQNFWPETISMCAMITTASRQILSHFFKSRRIPIYLNFSLSFAVVEDDGSCHFVYGSRSNFACLSTAAFCHDEASYARFLNVTLPNFDLANYVAEICNELDRKYDGEFLPARENII